MICPILKSGDATDCSNYIGITVGSILGKLYAVVLEKRISAWAENSGIRARGQGGFRSDHRTTDNIFILRTLIDKAEATARKKKLFVCFVDFQKAFDTIPRALLWRRLASLGLTGRMLSALKNMYQSVTACVKTPAGLTEFFPCTLGVKQGCPLSPCLFGLYIDKLEKILLEQSDECAAPFLKGLPVPILLYADDIALISESKEGLQNCLDLLSQFCDNQQLTVNLKKTQVVIFNDRVTAGSRAKYQEFLYKGKALDIVDTYTYLGLVFHRYTSSTRKIWSHARNRLLLAAKKSLFAMTHRIHEMKITSVPVICSLFDTLVAPVMSYGCEIWGVDYLVSVFEEAEQIHRSFLRRLVGVRKSTPCPILLSEFGRFPLHFQWQRLLLRYYNRLVELPADRLLKCAFLENVELDQGNHACWSRGVHSWIDSMQGPCPHWADYLHIPACAPIPGVSLGRSGGAFPNGFAEEVFVGFYESKYFGWLNSEGSRVKNFLSMYRCPTSAGYYDINAANYLSRCEVDGAQNRNLIARFRTGSHDLEIENGRWARPPTVRENRKCRCCSLDLVEDEYHFIFDCTLYYQIRGEYYSRLFQDAPRDLRTFFSDQNIVHIGRYLRLCFELRHAHLTI